MSETLALLNASGGEPSKASDAVPTVEAVQKQLADLQAAHEVLRKEHEAMEANQAALLSTPAQQAAPQYRPVTLDTKDLPDPVEDGKDKYAVELAKRYKDLYEAEKFNEQVDAGVQYERQAAGQALWEDFQGSYGEYSKDQRKLRHALDETMYQARRKRLDTDKYMYGTSTKFMKDLAKNYDDLFGKPVAVKDNDDEDEDDTRTMGVFGGQESGGKAASDNARTPEEPGGFTQAIRDFQIKHGYYR